MRLYDELAAWWPLLSDPADYAEEAALYRRAIEEAADGPVRTVLELGSGGGNNASHLKAHWRMTLVDLSHAMLAVSRARNPECAHAAGDMRTVRLGRTFDAVFVHDAVMYLTTEADLRAAAATAHAHLRPGGVALFVPDDTRESFRPGAAHGGHDGPGRGLRYLQWNLDPDPADTTFTAVYAFLLKEGAGTPRAVSETHTLGLFPRATWLRALADAGFTVRARPAYPGEGREMFLGVRYRGNGTNIRTRSR